MSNWNEGSNDWNKDSEFDSTDATADTAVEDNTDTAAEAPQTDENVTDEDQSVDAVSEAADGAEEAEKDDSTEADDDSASEEDQIEVNPEEVETDEDENWVTDELIQDVSRFTVNFIAADKTKREFLREIIRPRRGARAKAATRMGVSEIASALVFDEKTVNISTLFLLNSLSRALNPATQDFVSGMEAIEIINETEADDLRDLITFINDGVLSGNTVSVSVVTDEDKVERLRTGKTSTPAAQIIDSISKAVQKVDDTEAFFGLVEWSTTLTKGLVE